jgi:hypothetical protein
MGVVLAVSPVRSGLDPDSARLIGLDERPDLQILSEFLLVTKLFNDRPDSSLMGSFTAWIRHIAGTACGTRHYLNMELLKQD